MEHTPTLEQAALRARPLDHASQLGLERVMLARGSTLHAGSRRGEHAARAAARHQCDQWGLALSTEHAPAARAYERALWALLAHRADVGTHLDAALAADPGLALAHLMRGFGYRLLARGDMLPQARGSLAEAELTLAVRGGTPREALLADALRAFCADDPARAIAALEQAMESSPSCLLSMKLHHALCFMHGRVADMRSALERNLAQLQPTLPGYSFALGCYAFALEESSAYVEAEACARRALALCPDDPWSYHVLLHVMTMQDRTREGLTWVRARAGSFPGVNNFGGHIAWHHALFALAERELDEALELYDREIVGHLGRDYRDAANCASLLFRLARAGVDVGDRWQRLADWAEARTGDTLLAFADVHQLLALCGAGRMPAARRYARALRATLAGRLDGTALVTRKVGLPMVEGVLALYAGQGERALGRLWPLACSTARLGGSRAQRELFELLTIEAALAADQLEVARGLLADQLRERPGCAWATALLRGLDRHRAAQADTSRCCAKR